MLRMSFEVSAVPALCAMASLRIRSQGTMTPRSITLNDTDTCQRRYIRIQSIIEQTVGDGTVNVQRRKPFYLKLLQPSTTPTMFFPMSWTSPFTVASTMVPW